MDYGETRPLISNKTIHEVCTINSVFLWRSTQVSGCKTCEIVMFYWKKKPRIWTVS